MPAPTRAHSQLGLFSPRTLTIIVVLFGLMAIPIWWSKRSKTPAPAGVKITPLVGKSAATPAPVAPSAGAAVASPDRLGFSLGHGKFTHTGDAARLLYAACDGEPKDNGSGSGGMCNAQVGDASCRSALPILCIQKDSSTAQAAGLTITPAATKPETTSTSAVTTTIAGSPTESTTASATDTAVAAAQAAAQAAAAEKEAAEQQLQASWASGMLGATAPVAGFVVQSLAAANARCVAELGSGWRMATLGDGTSGKGLVGKRGPGFGKFESRLWVHSEGKKAHCWDPS